MLYEAESVTWALHKRQSSPLTRFFHAQLNGEDTIVSSGYRSLKIAGAMQNAASKLRARITKSNCGKIDVYQNIDDRNSDAE